MELALPTPETGLVREFRRFRGPFRGALMWRRRMFVCLIGVGCGIGAVIGFWTYDGTGDV